MGAASRTLFFWKTTLKWKLGAGRLHPGPSLSFHFRVVFQKNKVLEAANLRQSNLGGIADVLLLDLTLRVQAEEDDIKDIGVDEGKVAILILLGVVLVPDDIGAVLEGLQVSGLPPVSEGSFLKLSTVISDHVLHVFIEILGSVVSVICSHLVNYLD